MFRSGNMFDNEQFLFPLRDSRARRTNASERENRLLRKNMTRDSQHGCVAFLHGRRSLSSHECAFRTSIP